MKKQQEINKRKYMDKKLLIIGAGGHGKVVAEVASACGYDNVKFLDDNSPEAIGKIWLLL